MRYQVTRDGQPVLAFSDQPGHLLSTAMRPPGFTPPEHPFLDAQALDSGSENELAQVLAESANVRDFIAALGRRGYQVERR
jgi:hypothetical protein